MSIVLKIDGNGHICSPGCMFLHDNYCLLFRERLNTYRDEGEEALCCESCSHVSYSRVEEES